MQIDEAKKRIECFEILNKLRQIGFMRHQILFSHSSQFNSGKRRRILIVTFTTKRLPRDAEDRHRNSLPGTKTAKL